MEELSCSVFIRRTLLFYASLCASNTLKQHAIPRALYAIEVKDGPFRTLGGRKPVDGTELDRETALVF